MQNSSTSPQTGWHRVALWAVINVASVLAGCANEEQSPIGQVAESTSQGADPAKTMAQTMDWEMQWAQAALERNPNLEIIAADRELRSFTLRDRRNQATAQVQLAEIAAAPVALLNIPVTEPESVNDAPPAEVTPPQPPAPSAVPEAVESEPSEVALAVAPSPKAPPTYTVDRSGGRTRVTGDGISVVYGDDTYAATSRSKSGATPRPYTIDRSSGLVRVNGPGISIESSGAPRARPVKEQLEAGAEVEPVICEGQRVMQLDSRTIRVEGDALTARGGCELYITNSTIIASGTGVVIRDATVHINNSRIEGGQASFDAKEEQAKVFLRGSTLNGLSRRNQRALIQDQGGNSYH